MSLDPEMRPVLDALALLPKIEFAELHPLEAARRLRAQHSVRRESSADDNIETEDKSIPGEKFAIPLRIYRHPGLTPTGVMVNLHGGGWASGSLESDDARCRRLTSETGAAVVSVEYRLAPENPFPAAYEDSIAALVWAWDNRRELSGSECKLVVEGSSAGANLAAAAALAVRDAGPPLALQVLISPVCDDDFSTGSYREFGEGHFLTRGMMAWFWDQYVPAGSQRDGRTAILRAKDVTRAPPAHILIGGCDPLRDEGLAYAARLTAAKVPVQIEVYPGSLHSFTSLAPGSAQANRAFRAIGASVRRSLKI